MITNGLKYGEKSLQVSKIYLDIFIIYILFIIYFCDLLYFTSFEQRIGFKLGVGILRKNF